MLENYYSKEKLFEKFPGLVGPNNAGRALYAVARNFMKQLCGYRELHSITAFYTVPKSSNCQDELKSLNGPEYFDREDWASPIYYIVIHGKLVMVRLYQTPFIYKTLGIIEFVGDKRFSPLLLKKFSVSIESMSPEELRELARSDLR